MLRRRMKMRRMPERPGSWKEKYYLVGTIIERELEAPLPFAVATTALDGLLHGTVCHLVRTRVRWRNLAEVKATVEGRVYKLCSTRVC
jgi:hypothetical protein